MKDQHSKSAWTNHSDWAALLSARLPKEAFEKAKSVFPTDADISRFIKLWIFEGIPYAFEARPILYELLREFLAKNLATESRNISITGSGRLGFSVAPKKYLRDFQDGESDIDIFAISESYFMNLEASAQKWCEDYKQGRVQPPNSIYEGYWDNNLREIPGCLRRGFIDPNRVPPWPEYEPFGNCLNLAQSIRNRLAEVPNAPKFKKSSIRIYKDWDSAYRQIKMTFVDIFSKVSKK